MVFVARKAICEVAKDYFSAKTSREKSFQSSADSSVNRLHYKLTVILFLSFSVMITYLEFIEKINCIRSPGSKIRVDVINNYCFIQSTFTLPKHFKVNFEQEALIGVGTHTKDDETKYHAYYQWVPFVLFLQGIMFYVPHLILKSWDGDKIKKIIGK